MPKIAVRPPNGELKYYEPDEFSQRHELVCKLHAAGLRNFEIEAITGFSSSRVSTIIHDPRAKIVIHETAKYITSNVDDIGLRLKALANEALNVVVDQMRDSSDETIVQRSAFSLLDRAGYSKVEKKITMTAALSDKAAEALALAAAESANVIDAEYVIEN